MVSSCIAIVSTHGDSARTLLDEDIVAGDGTLSAEGVCLATVYGDGGGQHVLIDGDALVLCLVTKHDFIACDETCKLISYAEVGGFGNVPYVALATCPHDGGGLS